MIKASMLILSAAMMYSGLATAESTYVQKDEATLRALDKITGRSTNIKIKVGEPVVFGSLKVELDVCYQRPPEEPPESAAFLSIASTQPVAVETMGKDAPFSMSLLVCSPCFFVHLSFLSGKIRTTTLAMMSWRS